MDIIFNAMLFLVNGFKHLFDLMNVSGGYGWAIIALTTFIRLVTWPLNSAQTRSMAKMQELQPKIKQLQERYKEEPQKMQQEMMRFYAEHKFNPFSGCLPMLVQIPIFIGLYGMLVSPDFLALAGNDRFLFIDNLAHPLMSHSGKALDNKFNVLEKDRFVTGKKLNVTFNSGAKAEYPVTDPNQVLRVEPQPLIPGEPVSLRLNPKFLGGEGFPESFIRKIKSADLVVVNDSTKELERLAFTPTPPNAGDLKRAETDPAAAAWTLASQAPTVKGVSVVHWGVLILILLYTLAMVLYQRSMTKNSPPAEGAQAQMMKLMPFMFVGFLFFFPIPAGVILYLVATMLLMWVQNAWVHWSDARKKNGKPPASRVIDVKPET
ncbi:MAG: YidC/Oxa1 family membrane protein insertase [Vampirovibrionales bacterium]|nr:YidC/Oxa1 family membrane protein insertase [Vampirovibrionales bacterium]